MFGGVLNIQIKFHALLKTSFVCLFDWVYYDDAPALLVEEDLRFSSVDYFSHERAPE
jgi:hypothetical protein